MYYNTTDLKGLELQSATSKSRYQDEIVLDFFKSNMGHFSPEDVHKHLFTETTPLTSVRRVFNTLEKGLFIEKTGQMKIGIYGRPVNTWKLKHQTNQLTLKL